MKAEPTPIQKAIAQIKEAKENFPAIGFTDDYVDGFNKGMQMAEFILSAKYLKEEKEYARIQIGKDRVRVKLNAKIKVISEYEIIVDPKSIDNTPINLD